ncbi:MAG: LamG domain-containing protein [Promethearchaeota archaeon]
MKRNRLKLLSLAIGFCFMLTIPIYVDASSTGCILPNPGLVSWWPGDGNAYDIKNGNDGTLMGGATYAPGIIDQAFSFDGDGDYVWAPSNGIYELQELTIETWVWIDELKYEMQRFVSLEGAKAVLRHDGVTDSSWAGLGQLHFYMNFGGAPWNNEDDLHNIRVNGVLEEGVWHHVAGTYDGSVMRLYLDGEFLDSHQVSGTVFSSWGVYLSWPNEPLDGLLDEIGIYNHALSAEEIYAIYNAGAYGKCKVSVLTANLLDTIEEMNLKQGIDNNLDTKIQNVQAALDAVNAGNRADAINKLEAFINAVESQRGKALTDEQADILVEEAFRIINLIELYLGE